MSSVVQVMQIMFYGVATLFMICFMIIGIWAFVLYTKMFKNNRIQNYLLQKINDSISSLNDKNSYNDFQNESNESFDNSSSIVEESLFEQSKSDDMSHSDSLYKIK